jgi:hypothetical protein
VYLARLEAALASAPPAERREILLETQSHVLDRARRSPWERVEDVLAELGAPEAYARQFLPDAAAPAPDNALRAIARLAGGGWASLPALFAVATAYAVAVLALFMAAWEMRQPDTVGLWIGTGTEGRRILLGSNLSGWNMREVLGGSLVPLALLVAATIHLAVSALLQRMLRAGPAGTG